MFFEMFACTSLLTSVGELLQKNQDHADWLSLMRRNCRRACVFG